MLQITKYIDGDARDQIDLIVRFAYVHSSSLVICCSSQSEPRRLVPSSNAQLGTYGFWLSTSQIAATNEGYLRSGQITGYWNRWRIIF